MTPAITVPVGATLTLETRDCFDGQVDLDVESPSAAGWDRSRANPATGPVHVEGAEPGDMLVAHIESVRTAARGLLFGSARDGSDRGGYVVDLSRDTAPLPGGLEAPLAPVVGVIGVAPAGDAVPNTTPGDHGGNLDTTDVKAGATVYLPVSEAGGLFALGDLHALQGDGELCGQGIEVAGEVTVRLDLMKGRLGPWPVIRTPGHWAVLASAQTLDEAGDLALLRARDLLMSVLGVTDREAVMLLSTVGDLRVSQLVNPLKTVRVCIPGWVLPRS
jgi:amidase